MGERVYRGVFNTDEINLHLIRAPASALVEGYRRNVEFAIEKNLPIGLPSNISHDLHRTIGWSYSSGILLKDRRAIQFGSVIVADSLDEKEQLRITADKFRTAQMDDLPTIYFEDLKSRVAPIKTDCFIYEKCEAAFIVRSGLAAELYPDFFDTANAHVDKDGLISTKYLLQNMKMVQPGIFLDETRKLLLFAHPFFRRSLSRRNSMNMYFLSAFFEKAGEPDVESRILLDPDAIGHPDSLTNIIELEYWYGPTFGEVIDDIKNGVAHFAGDENLRYYEGIDATQFWWKSEKNRPVRIFESEELASNPAFGISEDYYGCRYCHAEYSEDQKNFTHFDGAIRGYDTEKLIDRSKLAINKAGKNSIYTKLFRFDGKITIVEWKAFTTKFYRGNTLVPDYLGAGASTDRPRSEKGGGISIDGKGSILALISFHPDEKHDDVTLISDEYITINDRDVWYLEHFPAHLQGISEAFLDSPATFVVRADGAYNFPRIFLGRKRVQANFSAISRAISSSIAKDLVSEPDMDMSLVFDWQEGSLTARLSIAGHGKFISDLLAEISNIVDVEAGAATWIEPLKDKLKNYSDAATRSTRLPATALDDGRLYFQHSPGKVQMIFPRKDAPLYFDTDSC